MAIPKIDPNVVHVTLGQFRRLQPQEFTTTTYVVKDGSNPPSAVCVPYEAFMEIQRAVDAFKAAVQEDRE